MTTLLVTHQACLGHDPGRMHPESPARLKAVLAALEAPEFSTLERRVAPLAEAEQIARVHAPLYVDRVLNAIPAAAVGSTDTIASRFRQAAWASADRSRRHCRNRQSAAFCVAADVIRDHTLRNTASFNSIAVSAEPAS